jgi:hypothetical protein
LTIAGASSALTSLPTATRTVTTTAASAKPTKPATSLHTDIQISLTADQYPQPPDRPSWRR